MSYSRIIETQIINTLEKQKVTLLLGARRVGKTSLLKKIFREYKDEKIWLNGEDGTVKKLLANRSIENYKNLLQKAKLLIIDEAQHIPEIGHIVKLMIDEITPLHIIITGSSAFDLAQNSYPLVGRSITHYLYPISQAELSLTENILETSQYLETRLLYGLYPEVFAYNTNEKKQDYLHELMHTYLLKDILEFENIRNPAQLKKLLEMLAYQTAHEVSETELANQLDISKNTVAKYLDLLEKVFVIFPLTGYSNNLRKEVTKSKKWFFYDTGIRNAIINNFSPLAIRQDIGQLWENYLIAERRKKITYNKLHIQTYFWRTYDQQEIDLIETTNQQITATEIKWKPQKVKAPAGFTKAYPEANFNVIDRDNYLEWIL